MLRFHPLPSALAKALRLQLFVPGEMAIRVPIEILICTQRVVSTRKLIELAAQELDFQPISLVYWDGELWIKDGNHRVFARAMQNRRDIMAIVFRLP